MTTVHPSYLNYMAMLRETCKAMFPSQDLTAMVAEVDDQIRTGRLKLIGDPLPDGIGYQFSLQLTPIGVAHFEERKRQRLADHVAKAAAKAAEDAAKAKAKAEAAAKIPRGLLGLRNA